VKALNLLVSLCLVIGVGELALATTSAESGKTYRVSYIAPVADPELRPYARFVIASFSKTTDASGVTTISYELPLELTGVSAVVTFSGIDNATSDTVVLSGPNGSMTCTREVNPNCEVKFVNLQIDQNMLEPQIEAISKSPEEVSARLKVAKSFRLDPGGVLSYEDLEIDEP
jgi:hypothetical protein